MVEADLEQHSGLVLRAKPDGERHVFKAPQGASLLGAPRAHAAVLAAWRHAYCITQLRCDQCPACTNELRRVSQVWTALLAKSALSRASRSLNTVSWFTKFTSD